MGLGGCCEEADRAVPPLVAVLCLFDDSMIGYRGLLAVEVDSRSPFGSAVDLL